MGSAVHLDLLSTQPALINLATIIVLESVG